MLRRLNSGLRARLDHDGARVRLVRGWRKPVVVHSSTVKPAVMPTDLGNVIDALDQALREMRESGHSVAGLRCNIVVSDVWMLYDVLAANLEDTPDSAAEDVVAAALADTAGTAGTRPADIVTRWQPHGDSRQFACGLPRGGLEALQQALVRHDVQLGSVQGELVRVFNQSLHDLSPQGSVLAIARPAGTQLGLIAGGCFAALRFEPSVTEEETDLLQARSQALMRSAGFEPNLTTRFYADQALPSDLPTPWSGGSVRARSFFRFRPRGQLKPLDLDLSPKRARASMLGWLLLGAGAIAAVFAATQFEAALAQRAREATELNTIVQEVSSVRDGDGSRTDTASPEARAGRATAAVVRELQVPWPNLLGALEAATGRNVALLAVEPSAARQEVRIMAEARNSDAMLDYLDTLRAQSLKDVTLVSHQIQVQAPGAPFRFQVRAHWGN